MSIPSTKNSDSTLARDSQITNAFLLGWALAETLGHARRGSIPGNPKPLPKDILPRLTLSDNDDRDDSTEYLVSAERVVQLYRAFEFEPLDRLTPLTAEVEALFAKLRAWYENAQNPPVKTEDLLGIFNPWSRQVGAQLNALGTEMYRAFVTGMSMADTYWALHVATRLSEEKRADIEREKLDLRHMLSKKRLDAEQRRLKTLQSYLPRYVVLVMCKHLEKWSIGETLAEQDGNVVVMDTRTSTRLTARNEDAIQKALRDQQRKWKRMLFGSWQATSFLRPQEQRKIAWIREGISMAAMSSLTAILIAALGTVFYVLVTVLIPVIAQMSSGAKTSDLIAFGALTLSVLLAILKLPSDYFLFPLRVRQNLKQWLDDWLTIRYVSQRTLVQWDEHLKNRSSSKAA